MNGLVRAFGKIPEKGFGFFSEVELAEEEVSEFDQLKA
jgi:hypothetical protein